MMAQLVSWLSGGACGGDVLQEEAEAPFVLETEARVSDDSVALHRAARSRLVRWTEHLVIGIVDAAYLAATDEHARDVLEQRDELRAAMASLGSEAELPLSFGSSRGAPEEQQQRGPKKKKQRKKKKQQSQKRQRGEAGQWSAGDLCECYYEGDGLWYVALVDEVRSQSAHVTLVGYELSLQVPITWIRPTDRAEEVKAYLPAEVLIKGSEEEEVLPDDAAVSSSIEEEEEVPAPVSSRRERFGVDSSNPNVKVDDKYWAQRHHYFSAFDEGILLDEEGWFSVTPERIAEQIAQRTANKGACLVVDAFCGCGGNAIAFAAQPNVHVIAIDMDPRRLEMARHNAGVYELAHRIEFVLGDALLILPRLRADVVFLSPPWGGPTYLEKAEFALRDIQLAGLDGFELAQLALKAAPTVVYYLPKTTPAREVADLAAELNGINKVELQSNFLNGKIKAKTAYFSQN